MKRENKDERNNQMESYLMSMIILKTKENLNELLSKKTQYF